MTEHILFPEDRARIEKAISSSMIGSDEAAELIEQAALLSMRGRSPMAIFKRAGHEYGGIDERHGTYLDHYEDQDMVELRALRDELKELVEASVDVQHEKLEVKGIKGIPGTVDGYGRVVE